MCFLKNIQPLRHGKMDGHIKIQMQKRRILLFLRHAALANTVVSEKHKPDTTNGAFIVWHHENVVSETHSKPK